MKNNGDQATDKDIEKALKLAQQKASEYIEKFKDQSFNLQQLINVLSNDNSQFKDEYEKQVNQAQQKQSLNLSNTNQNNHLSCKNSLLKSSNNDIEALKKKIKKLKIAKTAFITISASAAIAAAGFWAAAPWTIGATIPWAVGCTEISVASGFVSSSLSFSIIKADEQMPGWEKFTSALTSTYFIGHIFYKILYPILISLNVTLTVTSWVFPVVLSLIPITSSIIAWISLYS